MHFAKSPGKTDGEPQKEAQLQRRFRGPLVTEVMTGRALVKEPREWLALRVFKNQGCTALVLREHERPY